VRVCYGEDFNAQDTWSDWAAPGWQITGWKAWKTTDPSRVLVYTVGLGVAEDMTGGAAGAYDSYWKQLAQNLVTAGLGDSIIRIAHEFSGTWYWYTPQGREQAFIGYWRYAVAAMRSVAAQSFKFHWNPALGPSYQNGVYFPVENAY